MPVQSSLLSRNASRCDDQPSSIGCVDPSIGEFDKLLADIVVREGLLDYMGVSLGADFAGICK
jgi:hypothetical protein